MKIYRPKLKQQMQYCIDHPEEINKLAKVKAQVSEVKGVMMENIEKARPLKLPLDKKFRYENHTLLNYDSLKLKYFSFNL